MDEADQEDNKICKFIWFYLVDDVKTVSMQLSNYNNL